MAESDRAALLAAKLHSRYHPQAEAERYVTALELKPGVDYFIVIEPGLGYLVHALKKEHPESKAVVLHSDSCFRTSQEALLPTWYPDSAISVQEFLENEIPETASVHIIEWKPSVRVFGDSCLTLVRESAAFIKRAAASRRTGAAFGRKWLRNFFRNLTLLRDTVLYRAMEMPIVITGSGPSLESALPQILSCREGLFIIAASSSVMALSAGGIAPDMVCSTDGGGWALLHLHACFRGSAAPMTAAPMTAAPMTAAPMLAMALTAAIPSQCSALPILPMSDGSLWQSMALSAAGIPSVVIPQRGTVTASALELAMALTSGNIFLAGMDLSVRDIQSHSRPYGFDHLFSGSASRFRPVYSQLFARSSDIRAGGSHDVYAAWFNSRLSSWPNRIFPLGGIHESLESRLPRLSLATAGARRTSGVFKAQAAKSAPHRKQALLALTTALEEGQYAEALSDELRPLLFPSQPQASAKEIADALQDTTKKLWGEASG